MSRRRLAIGIALAALACSTAPKPRELEGFEKLRESPVAGAAQKRSPGLLEDADRLLAQARKEWQGGDLEDSRRDALLGSIKLKTAIALVEQERAKQRLAAAEGELARTEDELGRATKDLNATNEQVTLLQRLQEVKGAASQEQQRSGAQAKISAAELALKTADTVDAKSYAAAEYSAAADMLARAELDFKNGNLAAAQTGAELAERKAEQATATARPHYQQAEQTMANKARDEALGREAAGISGVTVKLERRGDVTRLVLPLHDLFVKKQTTVAPGHEAVLDQLAALLKKYPTYPVQVLGHSDNRGKHDELVALSLARAQSVSNALISRGVDPKRLVVSGQGPDEPVTDNRTASGRNQNSRVEVVFLYQ
jgi:outer membrane protein OmpA-like peptidoglycan-associated protein